MRDKNREKYRFQSSHKAIIEKTLTCISYRNKIMILIQTIKVNKATFSHSKENHDPYSGSYNDALISTDNVAH